MQQKHLEMLNVFHVAIQFIITITKQKLIDHYK